jgi:hypothetical protein
VTTTIKNTFRTRLPILLNGWFIVALAVLILNDHFLKSAYPSILTGKLSDFAGLHVFAVFLYVVLPGKWLSRRGIVWLHLAIGLSFVIWKLAPVEILLHQVALLTGLPELTRVKDATDLIALAILPATYHLLHRSRTRRPVEIWWHPATQSAALLVLLVAGWSIMATSKAAAPEAECCTGISGNVDHDEEDIADILDVMYLEDFLYFGGLRPECLLEADVDGSYGRNPVTPEDLIYLVDYIFGTGPDPVECVL